MNLTPTIGNTAPSSGDATIMTSAYTENTSPLALALMPLLAASYGKKGAMIDIVRYAVKLTMDSANNVSFLDGDLLKRFVIDRCDIDTIDWRRYA